MWAKGAQNQGATFYFTLPRTAVTASADPRRVTRDRVIDDSSLCTPLAETPQDPDERRAYLMRWGLWRHSMGPSHMNLMNAPHRKKFNSHKISDYTLKNVL